MEIKKCRVCDQVKSVNDFHNNSAKKDGRQTMCKECRKIYHRGHYLKNKERYIELNDIRRKEMIDWYISFKKKLSCSKCGENRYWVLDFHHLNKKEKEFNIAKLSRYTNKERLMKEINKCLVLCSNCHRDLHYLESLGNN